jgi:hypothetical protein
MLNKSPASTAVSSGILFEVVALASLEIRNRRQRHSAALVAVGDQTWCNMSCEPFSAQPWNNKREIVVASK